MTPRRCRHRPGRNGPRVISVAQPGRAPGGFVASGSRCEPGSTAARSLAQGPASAGRLALDGECRPYCATAVETDTVDRGKARGAASWRGLVARLVCPLSGVESVAVVAHPRRWVRPQPWLDGDEVDSNREPWDRAPIGQAILQQPSQCQSQMASLAVAEGLLSQPEVPPATPADLDNDKGLRRTRVDRHEIELVATDMDVPGQDGPARIAQPSGDELLGGVTRPLSGRPTGGGASTVHRPMFADVHHRAINRRSTGAHRRVPRDEGVYVAASSRRSRSTRSSVASSAITGISSRSSMSWVDGDADGSPSRSRSS
jgi:hypothetical protein